MDKIALKELNQLTSNQPTVDIRAEDTDRL
jgi:hypothetical protein